MAKFKDVGLYIFHGNGLCIYSHDSELNLDEQLISGFMSAIFTFLEHMNDETPHFLKLYTKINNDEYNYILSPYNDLFSMLIFRNINDYMTYNWIQKFANSVVTYVNEKYTVDDLVCGDNLKDIRNYASFKLEEIKDDVYTSYLKDILEMSIKYKVKEKLCRELIKDFEKIDVAQKIYNASLESRSKTFNKIIYKIDRKYYKVFYVLNLDDKLISRNF